MNPNWYKLQQEILAARSEMERAVYRAKLDRYSAKLEEYRSIAERIGIEKTEAMAAELLRRTGAISIDLPQRPAIHAPEIMAPPSAP